MPFRLRPVMIVAAATLALAAFLALIARPAVEYDTNGGYFLGHEIVHAIVGYVKGLFGHPDPVPQLTPDQVAADYYYHAMLANRSPAYGVFLYITAGPGTLWLMTLVQGGLAVSLLYALWRLAAPEASWRTFAAAMAGLIVFTNLPYFAGYAMPDIFASIAVLGIVIALVYLKQVPLAGRIALFVLLAFCSAAHSSIFVIGFMIVAAGALALVWIGESWPTYFRRAGFVMAATFAGMLSDPTYSAVYHATTGGSFGKPPFLMARVLADGPGRSYLAQACDRDSTAYELCNFRNLPLDDSDQILWSEDSRLGVFALATAEQRATLQKQEMSFVLASIAHDPLGEVGAAIANSWRQLLTFDPNVPLQNQHEYFAPKYQNQQLPLLVARAGDCASEAACAPRIDPALIYAANAFVVAIASLGIVLGLGWRFRAAKQTPAAQPERRVLAVVMLLVFAVLANAAVSGALSAVFSRYQARVIWLLPFAAMLLALNLRDAIANPFRKPAAA